MKKTIQHMVSLLLVAVMIVGSIPLNGFNVLKLLEWIDFSKLFVVEAEAATHSGVCGDNLTWSLDTDTCELIISGSGEMTNWSTEVLAPWYDNRVLIKNITIENGVTSIGDYAFYGCYNAKNVIIPDSVNSIGNYSFWDCETFSSIAIPNSVKIIGDYSFSSCIRLNSITIPDSVTTLGPFAFYDCTNLENVILSEKISCIGESTFGNCEKLISITLPDNLLSIGKSAFSGCSSLTSITIPDNVTSVGENAFMYCYSLESAILSNHLECLDTGLFNGCKSLGNITIPDSVESIGDRTFVNCDSLISIVIPDKVTSIGKVAFASCDSLASVTIGKGIENIDLDWFTGCINLTSFNVDSGNKNYTSYDGVLFDKNMTTLILYPRKKTVSIYTIPDSVECIGDYAFYYCSALENVTIPESVKIINDYAFYYCSVLANLTIPKNVQAIGKCAIFNCESLANITVDSQNNNYSSLDGVLFDKNKTTLIQYPIGNTRTIYTVPESVTKIGDYSFYNSNLTSVTLGVGVIGIGNFAFANCTNLKKIYYTGTSEQWINVAVSSDKADLTKKIVFECNSEYPYIGGVCGDNLIWTFEEASGVLTINGTGDMTNWSVSSDVPWYGLKSNIKYALIGKSVTSIDNFAFRDLYSLSGITVAPENNYYSNDDSNALFDKEKTTIIHYPKGNTRTIYTIPDSVISISDYAFYDCDNITNIIISNSTKSIGAFSFGRCDNLTEIIVPDSVGIIGESAFFDCQGLSSITIGNGVKSIGNRTFLRCKNLTSVFIPDNVETIGDLAFAICSNLTSVTIGKGVANIGNNIFLNCANLKNIYYTGTLEQWKNITHGSGYAELTESIVFECNSERPYTGGIYNENIIWKFYDDIDELEIVGVGDIESWPQEDVPWYDMRSYITKVSIEGNINNIGEGAFRDFDVLANVSIGNKVTNIGSYAFSSCDALESITIPDNVTSIDEFAFSSCGKLSNVTIGNKVISIGEFAFNDCDSLVSIEIPGSVTSIGDNAFYSCDSLMSFSVSPENECYVNDQYGVLFNKNKTVLIKYPAKNAENDYVIPDGVVGIADFAFDASFDLKSIILPESISNIGFCAFNDCFNLSEVYYFDSEENWLKVLVDSSNSYLLDATFYFGERNYITWVIDGEETTDFVRVGDPIIPPKTPEKLGYDFIGWTPAVTDVMPAEDLIFTAVWRLAEYTITFDTDGGNEIAAITGDYGTAVTAPADPTKEGNTFAGWDVEIPETMPAENITITAKWTVNQYTITFNTDGGSEVAPITRRYGVQIVAPTDPTKSGYTFAGWKNADNEDVTFPFSMPAGDMTLTAQWTVKQYTITFDTDGGTAIAPITQNYGTVVIAPAAPTKTGYTFAGWDTTVPSTMPAENVTITAKWTVNQYTITFVNTGDTTIDAITADYGSTIPVISNPTKTGYTFAGWDKTIPVTMPAENITITAEFDANSYDAIFNANGGKWFDDSISNTVATDFDSEIIVPVNPTRQGYDFVGWDPEVGVMDDVNGKTFKAKWTERNDTKYTVEIYKMGVDGTYTVSKEVKKGTTDTTASVTANVSTGFTLNPDKSKLSGTIAADGSLVLKIYYDRNKYSFTKVIENSTIVEEIYFDAPIAKPADPVKPGYKFIGWDSEVPSTMPAENLSFTAKFELSFKMSIRNPSTTTISYGNSIVLHADMNEALPSGWTIKWTADNGNFSYSANGETLTITPSKSGDTTFTATVYDENGNEISKDTQTMKSKAGFFDKIIAFFKKLFGLTKVIQQSIDF